MVFTTRVEHVDQQVIKFTCRGKAETADLLRLIDLVALMCQGEHLPGVLVDLSQAAVEEAVGHMSIGTHAALKLRRVSCLAVVIGRMKRRGVSERLVRREGIFSRSFRTRDEAERWLLHQQAAIHRIHARRPASNETRRSLAAADVRRTWALLASLGAFSRRISPA